MTRIILGAVITLEVLTVLAVIAAVGKERKPVLPGTAAIITLVHGLVIAGLVYVWSQT